MGVSPISLKKKRCSRHFSPMDRSAGRRRRSLANLEDSRVRGRQEALAPLSHVLPSLRAQEQRPKSSQKTPWGTLRLRFPYIFKISISLHMCGGNIYLFKTEFSIFKTQRKKAIHQIFSPRLQLVTYISMVLFKSFLKQPSKIPGPQRGCVTPQHHLRQLLPPVSRRSCKGVQQADCSPLPTSHSQCSVVTSRAKNSRRCCGHITWLVVMGTDPAAGVSRAWPAEGRIGLNSKKIASCQHPKGSGPGFGH